MVRLFFDYSTTHNSNPNKITEIPGQECFKTMITISYHKTLR